MGWEQHGQRRYLYSKRREGNRVVSEYVGTETDAWTQVVAKQVMEAQAEQSRNRAAERQRRRQYEAIDHGLLVAMNAPRRLAAQTLRQLGYHQHKGTWRKCRD